MSIEQNTRKDLSLRGDDAENVVGGTKTKQTSPKSPKVVSTYVPGDTGVVGPKSSGTAGGVDASGTDDEC